MQTFYNADIQRDGWSNETLSFTPFDTPFSPRYVGTREEFSQHMQANKSLFDNGSIYKGFSLINPTDSIANLDFVSQQKKWQALNNSLYNTRNSQNSLKTRLIGLDFETIRVANPNYLDATSAITEIGITETIVGKKSLNSKNSHSIAIGINQAQLEQYLKDIKQIKDKGLSSFDSSERAMITSELERLSRYSGNIENIFSMSHITNIGDVMTVKSLGTSKGFDLYAIEKGLINLSVLGGISQENYEKAVINAGMTITNSDVYSGTISRFNLFGLKAQTLDTKITSNQTLKDRIFNFFKKELNKKDTYITTFNGNAYDLPIYNSVFGNNLKKENTVDIYTANQYISGNQDIALATQIAKQHGYTNTGYKRRASQEGIAQALGITFDDTAHNAASDTKVANEIIANQNFYKEQGLPALASKAKKSEINYFIPNENTVLYALNSISFDKNGLDYLQDGSIYDVSGIQRGRYYSIGGVRQYKDGKVGIEFNTAASDTNISFVKVFDSLENAQTIIKRNFLADSTDSITQRAIDLNDYIVNADKARRNYEDLFSTKSITYNIGDKIYEGGYHKLTQYYNAYKNVVSEIGIIDDSVIKDIAETSNYDTQIITALKKNFGISEDKDVYKSLLRDFKAGFGKLHDESALIEYIGEQFSGNELNNYQKTIAAGKMRESLIKGVDSFIARNPYLEKNIPSNLYIPTRRDMFSLDINISGEKVNLDFQNRENAINVLTRSFYSKTTRDANAMQVATSMVGAIRDLHERGFVSSHFLEDFYRTAGIKDVDTLNLIKKTYKDMSDDEFNNMFKLHTLEEIQPRKLAEMIVSEIHNTYINPILSTEFNYNDYLNKDFSKFTLPNKDRIIKFLTDKSEITGSKVLFGARSNRYHTTTPIKIGDTPLGEYASIGDIFSALKKVDSNEVQSEMNKIISGINNLQTTLDGNEIKNQLMSNLNYSEEAANEIDRMLFATKRDNKPYGLTTYKSGEKTDFITQFAYSGKKGEDAFVLVNFNTDRDSNLAKVMETMSDTELSFKDKINLIKDNGYAAVFQLPSINKYDIEIDKNAYNDPFFSLLGLDNKNASYSFSTIETGDRGFQKMAQSHLASYDHGVNTGENTLEKLDISLTDDADMINSAYRKVRESLINIYEDTSMSTSEKYSKMTKLFRRAQNTVITDMPGPSGYQSLFVNGDWQKVFAPNIADIMQSTQLDIRAFEILALETAKRDVLEKNTTIADNILKLAGETTENRSQKLEKLINRVKAGNSVSEEFDEYFLKHFASVPMGLENNFKIEGEEAGFTFIDYVKNRMDKGYKYSDKTKKIINWLSSNKERISQVVKEKATHDKKISLLDTTMFNQYSVFDSPIRPVSTQQLTAQKFLPSEIIEQLGQDVIDKLQIKIGYDAMTTQRAELADAFKDYDLGNGIKYGQLEDGITANFKQMDSAEIISKFNNIQNRFDEVFESVYKNASSKFGISEEESKRLLQQAFDVMKNTSTNVYESRGILRASFANNDLFLSPNIRTVEFNNDIDDLDVGFLKDKDGNFIVLGKNGHQKAIRNNYIEQGSKFVLADNSTRVYNGPSGRILGDMEDFIISGKGHLIEDVQGVSSIKGFIGNEKFTAYTPEFDSFTSGIYKDTLGYSDKAKQAYMYYSDAIFDEIFGSNVSGVFDLPYLKHGSFGIAQGNYLNRIFYNVNKYIDSTGDDSLFTELDNIFTQAGPEGLKLIKFKGNITYDQTQMGKSGAFTQVENIRNIINQRALDSNDKYQNVWKTIVQEIEESSKYNTFRGTFHRGINNESMGGAINFDPRMEVNFRSKFMEDINEYITLNNGWNNFNSIESNGKKVTVFNYIADKIYEESVNNLQDTSKTPIDKMFGRKRESALNTVRGIELSTQYMNSPEKLQNSNLILDISLDNINLAPSGSDANELTKTGIYKLIDSKGVKYSDQIRQIAESQGKDINNIAALRINLGDGITFDNFAIKENGKIVNKKIGQLIVPLYDITPFKGEIQYTDTIRDLNKALEIAKNYGKKDSLIQSRKDLNEAVKKLYTTLAEDLNYMNKKSYVVSKTLKIPMKNSGMLHAESTTVPTVKAITDNYQTWINDENYRKNIIQAIKEGNIQYDIDVASSGLTGRKYTTVRNGKLYYDDIVEMGREGFIQKGIDFEKTGMDIYFDSLNGYKNYRPYIQEMQNSFFDKDYAKQIIDSGLQTEEIRKALQSQEEYNQLLKNLKSRNFDKELVRKIREDIKVVNNIFDEITEDYLTEVGTFGLAARYPTFMEDSTNIALFKLNKNLRKDEMTVSGALGHKLNMDHDGDKGVVKLMLDEGGKLLSRADNKLYSAFNKAYEMQVYNLRNNEIMADLIQKASDKIKEIGSAVDPIADLVHKNVIMKKTAIMNFMQSDTRNELLTELGLEKLVDLDITKYTDDEVNTVFKAWDKKYGNIIKNAETIAATIKAKITKNEIGTVSNINYMVNQVLYESMVDALESGDKEAKAKYNRIKTDLHIGNMGLLPETEQKAIDVKHSYQGLTISETKKYNEGVVELFKGNREHGQQLIRQAMGEKFEKDKLNKFIGSMTELSKDNRAATKFKLIPSSKISSLNKALDYIEKIQKYTDYAVKNGLRNDTAIKSVYDTMVDLKNAYTMGYYHNDALQTVQQDAVFISTKDGKPILYKINESKTNKNFNHEIFFDTFDLNDGSISKGLPNWNSRNVIISGNAMEIQSKLQSNFGDFRAYSMAEVTGDIRTFKKQINNLSTRNHLNKFAQMYSRGNTEMAMKYLSDLQTSGNKKAVKMINAYRSTVSEQDFIEFINKAEFIKSNPRFQKEKAFSNTSIINDLLTSINKQIIEKGKNKKTSTSDIFDNALKQIANDVGLSKLNTSEYQQFVNTKAKATSDIFKGYEEKIIDVQKASRDFSEYTNVKNEANKVLNSYREQNNKYINSLKIDPSTTSDLDTIFNWNSNNLGDMRVGVKTENNLYGRRFSDLSEADIKEILDFDNRDTDSLSQYAYDMTKSKLLEFKEINKSKITNSNGLQGALRKDIISLKELNEKILQDGAEAIEEGLNSKGKKISKEQANKIFQKTLGEAWDKTKEFAKTTPGKAVMGLAALGLVSNLLSSGENTSPLAPELNQKSSVGPTNNDTLIQKAPSSANKKVVYSDNSSGLQFKMSGKSRNKINQINMARQLSAQTGGDTNVNVYDDRSQVSNNWLERKFSELV